MVAMGVKKKIEIEDCYQLRVYPDTFLDLVRLCFVLGHLRSREYERAEFRVVDSKRSKFGLSPVLLKGAL